MRLVDLWLDSWLMDMQRIAGGSPYIEHQLH